VKPYKRVKSHNLIDPYESCKTFKDLNFHPHKSGLGGQQAIMKFDNGHRISVVGGGIGLYGDGINTFEIWRSCDSDVKGYLTKEEVTEEMIELQKLDRSVPRNKNGF
jgi:hypothetical protein